MSLQPAHWFRFKEGIGANLYDLDSFKSRLNGQITGTFQWISSPLQEEETDSLTITSTSVGSSDSSASSKVTCIKDLPALLLDSLSGIAKSFEKADQWEKAGLGVGVKVQPPRQAVFPFVTTFNLLHSLIGQVHQGGGSAATLVSLLDLLASNLYAVSSSHFNNQMKTGLGVCVGDGNSFCERLLNRVREVADNPPCAGEEEVIDACARVVAVGCCSIFYPSHSGRRSFITKLISDTWTRGSQAQVEHVCRMIAQDMELVAGLLTEGNTTATPTTDTTAAAATADATTTTTVTTTSTSTTTTTPLEFLTQLVTYARGDKCGKSASKLLLLLQQVLVGMVPSHLSVKKEEAPMLHLLNSLTEQSMCKPMTKDLTESKVRLQVGASDVKVKGGNVTHQGSDATYISITAQDCLYPHTGEHILYFKIKSGGDGMSVGLAGDEFNHKTVLGKCKQSIGWHLQTGETYCLQRSTSTVSHKVDMTRVDSLISMKVDTSTSPPTVVLRDEETCHETLLVEMGLTLGKLFTLGPVYPAVSMHKPGQSVTFLRRTPSEGGARHPIKTDTLALKSKKSILLPYCEVLSKAALEELAELTNDKEKGLTVRRPVLVLTKAMCATLLIIQSSSSSLHSSLDASLDVSGMLRAAESLREKLSQNKQFEHMEDIEELIITLALLGVGEASRLISGEYCDKDEKYAERSDKLLEAGFKDTREGMTSEDEDGYDKVAMASFMCDLQSNSGVASDLRTCVVDYIGSRPFKQLAAQGDEIAECMHMLTTCMLYHAGALPLALKTGQEIHAIKSESGAHEEVLEKLAEIKLSKLLVKVWEAEKVMRMWCRQQKTGKKIDYSTQALILTLKLEFLLELMPRLGFDHFEGEDAQYAVVDQVLKFVKSDEDVEELRRAMTSSLQRARQREQGLIKAKELLRFDSLPLSARAAIMSKLKLFRSGSQSGSGSDALHYLDEFHCSGLSARSSVKSAFDALFMRMGKELEVAVECGDMELQLVVLNTWGLRLKPEDHSLLSHARLFDTLQLILQQQEDTVLETPAHIQRLKLLKKTTLKLIILLATQV